jgi:hypothetical protein
VVLLRSELATHRFSNAGIVLYDLDLIPPRLKVSTNSLRFDKGGTIWRPHGGSFLWSLEYLQVQAGPCVRGDVAVHEPTARVVSLKSNDDVCFVAGHDDITSGRVMALEILVLRACALNIVWVKGFIGLVDDGKVVTVEMNLRICE